MTIIHNYAKQKEIYAYLYKSYCINIVLTYKIIDQRVYAPPDIRRALKS